MKYEQPYGVSDPNAAYINGNPSTGTMGSIPPAASIENPQREIVNFINDSGLTATDADLHQLAKSTQSGHVNYCADQGTPNFVAITPTPAVTAYTVGLHFRIKLANSNTGPSQVNVSNVGWAPLVHSSNQTAIGGGELFAGQIIEITWDGSHWQILSGGSAASGGLIFLTAPRTLYVNDSTGNDTLYDGTQAAVDAVNGHGPFKTLPKALSVMTTYNLSGFTFTIQLADGTYAQSSVVHLPIPNGSGNVMIRGNPAAVNNVHLVNNGSGSVLMGGGGSYYFDGVYFAASAPAPADPGHGLWVSGAMTVWLSAVGFGLCAGSHLNIGPGGLVSLAGPVFIYGGAGNAHISAGSNGVLQAYSTPLPTLTFVAAAAFGIFVSASTGAQVAIAYAAIVNPSFASGAKFAAIGNGVINTQGNGASYLPGTIVGGLATGGQYI